MTLPYDMGNAGDLLRHGVLAEFVRWQCRLGVPLRVLLALIDKRPAIVQDELGR